MGLTHRIHDVPPVPGGVLAAANDPAPALAAARTQPATLTAANLARLVDHTTLKPTDTAADITAHIAHACDGPLHPYAVCVTPDYAHTAVTQLAGTPIAVASVAGAFPHGRTVTQAWQAEVDAVLDAGVDELDVVLDRALFLSGEHAAAYDKIVWIRDALQQRTATDGTPRILKLILEVGELPDTDAIVSAAWLALHAGADLVKTSTGTIAAGATPETVLAIAQTVDAFNTLYGTTRGVKVSGGVATVADAVLYYTLVESVFGDATGDPLRLRFGASRLLHALRKETP